MTASRSRRRSAAYAALALGLCGTLALTGCNSHKKSKKHTSSSTHKSSSHKSKKRKIIGGGAAAAGAGAGAAAHRTTKCPTSSYRLTVSHRSDPSRLVVTYRNKGSHPCYLYGAPQLRFGAAKEPLQPLSGKPSVVDLHRITVAPRAEAYAVIPTTTAATKGTKQSTASVALVNSSGEPATEQTARLDFSDYRSPVSVGTKAKVGDWYNQLSLADLKAGTDR